MLLPLRDADADCCSCVGRRAGRTQLRSEPSDRSTGSPPSSAATVLLRPVLQAPGPWLLMLAQLAALPSTSEAPAAAAP